MQPALSIKNLEKTYASGTHALNGVSLEVPSGDFYALLGLKQKNNKKSRIG